MGDADTGTVETIVVLMAATYGQAEVACNYGAWLG